LRVSMVPVFVISSSVGGVAAKGPAAMMMSELGMPQKALGVDQHYVEQFGELVKGFVLDTADAALEEEVNALGLATIVTKSVMLKLHDKIELAKQTLAFASTLEA